MNKKYIIKRFYDGAEALVPYYGRVHDTWNSDISKTTFFSLPEEAFVELNRIKNKCESKGYDIEVVEIGETIVRLKVEPTDENCNRWG